MQTDSEKRLRGRIEILNQSKAWFNLLYLFVDHQFTECLKAFIRRNLQAKIPYFNRQRKTLIQCVGFLLCYVLCPRFYVLTFPFRTN